ncbi:hypothetical protein [Streptomyces sp. NBC_00005]|uniref:hypothetical protein n=1 Tax=Streptomyces sp. NBC_00005 TaxID=2903609 RepID=UPI003248E70F
MSWKLLGSVITGRWTSSDGVELETAAETDGLLGLASVALVSSDDELSLPPHAVSRSAAAALKVAAVVVRARRGTVELSWGVARATVNEAR